MIRLYPKPLFALLSFVFICTAGKSQETISSEYYYNAGLTAISRMEYRKADSLFTKAIRIQPDVDSHFNRAVCRKKLGNQTGFCEDLAFASRFGDKEAAEQFCNACGTVDTVYLSSTGERSSKKIYTYMQLKYQSRVINEFSVYFNWQGKWLPTPPFGDVPMAKNNKANTVDTSHKKPEIFTLVEETAEFPGGLTALMKFIKENVRVPAELTKKGINGRVFVKFIIDEEGLIQDPFVLKAIDGCMECSTEALRLVKIMPRWTPARMSGVPVKIYFNLPIKFSAN